MIKLGIIYGGLSPEHEISILSYNNVINNINKNKYIITTYYITKDNIWLKDNTPISNIFTSLKEQDIIFPILHGTNGEDGSIYGLLDMLNIKYIGNSITSSSICMDKLLTKKLLSLSNINVSKYLYINKIINTYYYIDSNYNYIELNKELLDLYIKVLLNYPVVVKPTSLGSSIGVTLCNNITEVINSLDTNPSNTILIEEYITGKEIEVALLGSNNDILVSNLALIDKSNPIYTYNLKYNSNTKTYILKDIDTVLESKIKEICLSSYKTLSLNTLARIDLFIDNNNTIIVNEVNTLPGLTKKSMYPILMEDIGISFTKLIDKLIELSIAK